MPWNGSGNFTRKHNWTQEAAQNLPISATSFDDDTNDITTAGLGNCITRDGQGIAATNISWGGYRITNLGNVVTGTDATNANYVNTATQNRSMGGFNLTNLANPVNPQDAATMSWVQGTTTALPSQGGNAGLFLTTNGAVASWASQYPVQTGHAGQFLSTNGTSAAWSYPFINTINALATANVTLNGSLQYQPIAMTSLGQSITLPAANGLATGGPQFILDNTKGTYSVGIRDNTGTLIMAIAPGGEALVALKDNSSAAGVWAVTGSQLEPGLITVDNLFSATYAATYLAPYAALDSNTSIHFVALASNGFAAVVVDNAGKVLTTPVTVSTTANSVPVAAFRVDATHALVFFGSSTTDHQAVVLSLSGSSPTFSLAVGTAASLTGTFSAAWGGENSVSQPRIAQLAGSQYLFVTISGTNTAAVSISVSGTTVSIGALTNIITSNSNANTQAVYPLTATTGLVLYVSGAAAPYTVNAVVVTSSGTTSTIGTPAAGGTLASVSGAPMSCLLSATKAIFASDNNSATTMQCQAVTISAGTSVAIGAALSVETAGGTVASPNNTYTAWGSGSWTGTRTNPHLFGTAANSAIFSYADSTAISRVCTLSESGGVLTKGATVYQSLMPNSSNGEGLLLPPGSSTEFLAAQVQTDSTTTHGRPFVTPHLINGTVVTTGHEVTLADAENIVNSLSQTAATRLSQGDYLIGFCGPNSNNRLRILNVLRSNGVQLNNRGSLKMPNFQPLSMPLQAPASNRAVILGRTVASTAGTATSQLRLLNLEIAA